MRKITNEDSGINKKAGDGGEVFECGKHRQISSDHAAFLFEI